MRKMHTEHHKKSAGSRQDALYGPCLFGLVMTCAEADIQKVSAGMLSSVEFPVWIMTWFSMPTIVLSIQAGNKRALEFDVKNLMPVWSEARSG